MPTPEEIAAAAAADQQEAAAKAAAEAAGKTDDKAGEDGKTEDKPDPHAELRGKDLSADEVTKLLDKLTAANGEAASYRHKLREAELAAEGESEKKIREAKESGAAEAAQKYTPIIIKGAAVSELTAAGATSGHDSLIRLLDTSKIEVAEDGSVKGVKAEVERIKKEFPALFAGETRQTRRTAGSALDAGGAPAGGAKKTSAQIHAERVLGQG